MADVPNIYLCQTQPIHEAVRGNQPQEGAGEVKMTGTDSHHSAHQGHDTSWVSSAHATVHCLTGCMIGEASGLAIGVSLGLGVVLTIALAVVLAYIAGFALAIIPIMQREGLGLLAAAKVVRLGELISIGVMELVMNGVDYLVGGVQVMSIWTGTFWLGLAVAGIAGFVFTWPVMYWLLNKQLKVHH